MLGAIIGDIVGSRWEFKPTNDYHFEWLSPENEFTDDTICTIAVADALIKGRDFGESLHDWCNRYPNPKGSYGGRFSQWVHSQTPQPYGSFGNGSAMRVSAVGHWFKTKEKVLKAAEETALPTHNHPEGIKGAQTVALAIYLAMKYNRQHYQRAAEHIDDILKACVDFSGYDINMPKRSVLNKFDETCQGTVPVALKIISMSTCFEDAVRLAVSLGGDADTLGAIVGSMAEPIWGIPFDPLRHQIEHYQPEEMRRVLWDFYSLRPYSFKPLIDTTYAQKDYSEGAWDMLDDDEREELMAEIDKEKDQKRMMMQERGKARLQW